MRSRKLFHFLFAEWLDLQFFRFAQVGLVATLTSFSLSACSLDFSDIEITAEDESFTEASLDIIGGNPVTDSDWVSQSTVALYYADQSGFLNFFCTGVIVTKQHVLTAAHCLHLGAKRHNLSLEEFMSQTFVGFGTELRFTIASAKTNGGLVSIASHHMHPSYKALGAWPLEADIAVLSLSRPVPLDYTPVFMAQRHEAQKGATIRVVGFGQVLSGDGNSLRPTMHMHQVDLRLATWNIDQAFFSHKWESEKGFCFGDSGGPAYIKDPQGVWKVLGIVSWTTPNCRGKGFYASVPHYYSWILERLNVKE